MASAPPQIGYALPAAAAGHADAVLRLAAIFRRELTRSYTSSFGKDIYSGGWSSVGFRCDYRCGDGGGYMQHRHAGFKFGFSFF